MALHPHKVLHRQAGPGKRGAGATGQDALIGELGWSTLVAVATGASASPCLSPGPCPCPGLDAAGPSHLAWLALSPTPLSSAAAPCPAHAPVLAHAPSACAHALGHAPVPAPVLVVCFLALVPSPVPGLKIQIQMSNYTPFVRSAEKTGSRQEDALRRPFNSQVFP